VEGWWGVEWVEGSGLGTGARGVSLVRGRGECGLRYHSVADLLTSSVILVTSQHHQPRHHVSQVDIASATVLNIVFPQRFPLFGHSNPCSLVCYNVGYVALSR
jgi:hypothetical protein